MPPYRPTIGLEIHAELRTKTKMFCASKNDPEEKRPNVNICPVCLAHPGTLPVINREAVLHVLRVGAALGARLADYSEFDRKNYFYPDLPKGYQISQYEYPLVSGGSLAGVRITRVHLEEDTASSIHGEKDASTLIDFNRAGLPLMELVTEPVIGSPEEAGNFARELQLLLRYLGVSEASMEKGQMRVEANISVSRGTDLGTKVEIKNLNSFRAMERAVAHEITRQEALLEEGEAVSQETRGWDEVKQATFSQRAKEGSADYRYFPDPDLPSFKLSEIKNFSAVEIEAQLPELPEARRIRYLGLGLKKEDAAAFVRDMPLGAFFEQVLAAFAGDKKRVQLAANYIANDLVKIIRDTKDRDTENKMIPVGSSNFGTLITMLADGKISSRSAKDLLAAMAASNQDPEKLACERNLLQSVEDIGPTVKALLAEHVEAVRQYKTGKTNALEFLVGQGMRAMKGRGNPSLLRAEIRKQLEK